MMCRPAVEPRYPSGIHHVCALHQEAVFHGKKLGDESFIHQPWNVGNFTRWWSNLLNAWASNAKTYGEMQACIKVIIAHCRHKKELLCLRVQFILATMATAAIDTQAVSFSFDPALSSLYERLRFLDIQKQLQAHSCFRFLAELESQPEAVAMKAGMCTITTTASERGDRKHSGRSGQSPSQWPRAHSRRQGTSNAVIDRQRDGPRSACVPLPQSPAESVSPGREWASGMDGQYYMRHGANQRTMQRSKSSTASCCSEATQRHHSARSSECQRTMKEGSPRGRMKAQRQHRSQGMRRVHSAGNLR